MMIGTAMMIRTLMMIRNSMIIYAFLIVHLSLWPLRVLILGYLINDIKDDIKNDIYSAIYDIPQPTDNLLDRRRGCEHFYQ